MTSAVPCDPEMDMDFWYSSAGWKDILGADKADTICVPPCLDVLKSWKRDDLEEASHLAPNISGQKGEAAFMLKFQELNMGGILVSGLKSCDLIASQTVTKEIIQKGEWDAIFFHQKRGIFVIEVKATLTHDKATVDMRVEQAKTQLDRNIKNIQRSFLMLYQKECTNITGFICFPFRNEDRKNYEGYRIIDKSALNDCVTFRQFFETQTKGTMTEVSLLQSFAAEFVCCRSQVEFHSQAYNAMQVATWIMEQDIAQKQDLTKLVNVSGNGSSGKIILTAQQLEIVECREKCITIHGAPGSGKTLILMLRALKAAMENKAGSVFVFVNEKLKAKYEHYFFEERDKIFVNDANNIDRTPNVQTIDKINFAEPEDDIFFDETPIEDFYIKKIKSRVNCSGKTTAVFTGLHKPGEAVASFRLYRPKLKQFRHFELMKVLRGTGNIFRKWKYYYPHGIKMGHNICGVKVQSVSFDNFEQMQNEVANKIATLTSANISNIDLPSLKKEHIAVITCDDKDSTAIRNHLKTKDVLCGQVNEQARRLRSISIVAVDVYLNTPSYEWPIVFIILKPGVSEEEILPIAASRCIASLTIITYTKLQPQSSESIVTQEIINELKQSLSETYSTRFQKVYPFSLPFTFDIENSWVSLALREEKRDSEAIEDHAELLKRAFEKAKMLIIEGDPATGKTSLMRRLAYEWAKGKQELLHYDLVLYAEFRKVREKTFPNIANLVLCYSKNYLTEQSYENLKELVNDKQFCKEYQILVLLDGYDESSLEEQCSELNAYLFDSMIDKGLLFHVILTTRKGYLSNLHGLRGRFVFAEVLGFVTKEQKDKYIFSHFLSPDIDKQANIAGVNRLLASNENLNELAETPLFLTFICLVHERIIDGTLLELYCNIIWWLIDRHQKSFPDQNVPNLFDFQTNKSDKFEIIQDHYLHFPQLRCLGNMALRKLEKDEFNYSDLKQFNLQPILEEIGLLRKERNYDNSFKLATTFSFPHRTIHEFLAAYYCFCSNNPTSEWLLPNSKLDTTEDGMNEFSRFLLRIALADKLPIHAEKRRYYFERITVLELDITFDAFYTTAGFNSQLLSWFLSQCINVQNITLYGKLNSARHARNMLNETSTHNESAIISIVPSSALFSFGNLIKLHSVKFSSCTFEANSQLPFTSCSSLKYLHFIQCEMKSGIIIGIATLQAIHTVKLFKCELDLATWQSITNQIRNSSVKYLKLTFGKDFNKEFLIHLQECNNVENMEITIWDYKTRQNDFISFSDLITLQSLTFRLCALEASFQLSFTNCPSLKNLIFKWCKIESSENFDVAILPAINTVGFIRCKFDLSTWQSITNQIGNSSVEILKLSADFFAKESYPEFLHHLQNFERIQQIQIEDVYDSNSGASILNRFEEEVTANLTLTAQKLSRLTSITIWDRQQRRLDGSRRLEEENKERIEKAGQQRNPDFLVKYVE